MLKNKVWDLEGIDKLPPERKGIGCKWVFAIKRNGVYRARLVAKGYDQIPGVDFNYNFAPVTSDATLRIFFNLITASRPSRRKVHTFHKIAIEYPFLKHFP